MRVATKMTKSASETKPSSTSSDLTEASQRSEKILELGRRLVEELRLEPSVDTLGRWMSHYIAELMTAVEAAAGEERIQVEKRCFEAILGLWQHRSELPTGKRPFADLEPVIRAVESLDPEDDTPRYFRSAYAGNDEEEKGSEAQEWLKIARDLDYTAKVLIGESLAEAARKAADKSKEWVALAEAAGAERGVPEIVIQFLTDKGIPDEEPDPYKLIRERLENRIERLESFTRLAAEFADAYRAELRALPEPKIQNAQSQKTPVAGTNEED